MVDMDMEGEAMSGTDATIKFLPQKMLSQRKGCDLCKLNSPTQLFIGVNDDLLWFCDPCRRVLTAWR